MVPHEDGLQEASRIVACSYCKGERHNRRRCRINEKMLNKHMFYSFSIACSTLVTCLHFLKTDRFIFHFAEYMKSQLYDSLS